MSTMRYVANPVVSSADEGDAGTLLFNPDTDDTAIINATGQLIWDLLSSPHTTSEIIAYLAARYPDTPVAALNQHVEQFIEVLLPDFICVAEEIA